MSRSPINKHPRFSNVLPLIGKRDTYRGKNEKIGDVYWRASVASETVLGVDNAKSGICYIYSPLPERPRLSLRTINLIQSGMLVRKCISGEKSDIVLSNHNYGRRQIKAK